MKLRKMFTAFALAAAMALGVAARAVGADEYYCLVVEDNVVTGIEWREPAPDDAYVDEYGYLEIPDGVIEIADGALECSELIEVFIPDSVERIGESAFAMCENLAYVYGGEELLEVGAYAFENTCFSYGIDTWDDYDPENDEFAVVFVGDFVVGCHGREALSAEMEEYYDEDVGDYVGWEYELDLYGCTGVADCALEGLVITCLVVDDGMKYVGEYAFADCCMLKYVDGLSEDAFVAETAFEGTPYVEGWDVFKLIIEDDVVVGYEWLNSVECGDPVGDIDEDGCLVIPEGVMEIADEALNGIDLFTTAELPSTLTHIGNEAFAGCCRLNMVYGGDNLASVGYDAFEDTPFLFDVDSLEDLDDDWEELERGLTICYIGNFAADSYGSLEAAWDEDQYDCDKKGTRLWTYDLTFPDGTTGMANWIFAGLPITSVTIPDSVKRIAPFAFNGCCQLRSLTFGDGVEEIGEGAFDCAACETGITRITLPSLLKKIDSCAFRGFGYLKYVDGLGDNVEIAEDAFTDTPYQNGWEVPQMVINDGVLEEMEWVLGWDGGCITNGVLVIPEGVTGIVEGACCGLEEMRKVVLPSTLKSIGDWAFECCENLNEVEGEPELERVGYGAFEETPFLYGVDSLDDLDEDDWNEIYRGLGIRYVGNFIVGSYGWLEAFWDEGADKSQWKYDLVIPDGTSGMADAVFADQKPITSVTIPGSVKKIPRSAFSGCDQLKELTLGDGVEEIGEYAFAYTGSLEDLDLPASVRTVREWAFDECEGLKTVIFRSDKTGFDTSAFALYVPDPSGEMAYNKKSCDIGIKWTEVCNTNLESFVLVQDGYTHVGWSVTAQPNADKSKEGSFSADDFRSAFGVIGEEYCVTNGWYSSEEYSVWDAALQDWVYCDPPVTVDYPIEEWLWAGYTAKAVATPNVYTVSFDANGGTAVDSVEVAFDSAFGALSVPTKTGYAFVGWFDGDVQVTSETKLMKASDVKLVAKWTANAYKVSFDANGGTGSMAVQTFVYDAAGTLAPNAFVRKNHEFLGWTLSSGGEALFGDGEPVKNLSDEDGATVVLYAVWERKGLWEDVEVVTVADPVTGEILRIPTVAQGDEAFAGDAAAVYDGYVMNDDGAVLGIVQVKVGKAGKKDGVSKVTATVQMTGQKKLTYKGGEWDADSIYTTLEAKGGETLRVALGKNGMTALYGDREVSGARNFFASKAADDNQLAAAAIAGGVGAIGIAVPAENGWDTFSLVVDKKGKAKFSGTLADGTKVSANSQVLVGDGMNCIPVVVTKKASLAFTVWFDPNGTEFKVEGLGETAVVNKPRNLLRDAHFIVDKTKLVELLGETLVGDCLPDDNLLIGLSGQKWQLAKAGKVVYKKGTTEIDRQKAGLNPSALKLTYKDKDGTFKGSFKAYVASKGKLKSVSASVVGVLVNGVGYGTATIKKVGSVVVEIW